MPVNTQPVPTRSLEALLPVHPAALSANEQGAASPRWAASGRVLDGDLTEIEQRSLWQALSEARREVRAIPEAWSAREENRGYDLYALHPKQKLTARFGRGTVRFVSSIRSEVAADANRPGTPGRP